MKDYFKKILIFFLGFCVGIGIGMAIAYKNVYDAIPWEEEIHNNTLEWEIMASDIEYLSTKLSKAIEQFAIDLEIMFPALAEQ